MAAARLLVRGCSPVVDAGRCVPPSTAEADLGEWLPRPKPDGTIECVLQVPDECRNGHQLGPKVLHIGWISCHAEPGRGRATVLSRQSLSSYPFGLDDRSRPLGLRSKQSISVRKSGRRVPGVHGRGRPPQR
jgi:hypothetical protein